MLSEGPGSWVRHRRLLSGQENLSCQLSGDGTGGLGANSDGRYEPSHSADNGMRAEGQGRPE